MTVSCLSEGPALTKAGPQNEGRPANQVDNSYSFYRKQGNRPSNVLHEIRDYSPETGLGSGGIHLDEASANRTSELPCFRIFFRLRVIRPCATSSIKTSGLEGLIEIQPLLYSGVRVTPATCLLYPRMCAQLKLPRALTRLTL